MERIHVVDIRGLNIKGLDDIIQQGDSFQKQSIFIFKCIFFDELYTIRPETCKWGFALINFFPSANDALKKIKFTFPYVCVGVFTNSEKFIQDISYDFMTIELWDSP